MIKRLLLATDFSPISERAEDYALSLAGSQGAAVTLLYAIEPVEGAEGDSGVSAFLETRRAKAEADSAATMKRFRDADVPCELRIEIGKRWKTIVDHGKQGGYELVVLGSHKIHDGDKVYLGTTTHKVFFGADLPLLVVPST